MDILSCFVVYIIQITVNCEASGTHGAIFFDCGICMSVCE